ncbi:hypothetical protein VK98_09420 [Chromobacterium sp. LK11]|uniref:hypothetical protein n=1 Tax=Chromobacterium sp. LK11 TaxID=1628212 RepID=UPI00065392A2|nr:hypothetical protein [Chromobacterium sp. LK11]KMN82303.1 hypothetical protein VK98_09420 [Chromobacterium sp. LK11]
MKSCPTIQGLALDQSSLQALEQIELKLRGLRLAASLTGVGVISNIFYRSSPLQAAYNIQATDWRLFAQSTAAWPRIMQKTVQRIAEEEHWSHQHDRKQARFWEAVAYGCKP